MLNVSCADWLWHCRGDRCCLTWCRLSQRIMASWRSKNSASMDIIRPHRRRLLSLYPVGIRDEFWKLAKKYYISAYYRQGNWITSIRRPDTAWRSWKRKLLVRQIGRSIFLWNFSGWWAASPRLLSVTWLKDKGHSSKSVMAMSFLPNF